MKNTTEAECLLLITAAQLCTAADRAPDALRRRMQKRASEMLDEADALEPMDLRNALGERYPGELRTDQDFEPSPPPVEAAPIALYTKAEKDEADDGKFDGLSAHQS